VDEDEDGAEEKRATEPKDDVEEDEDELEDDVEGEGEIGADDALDDPLGDPRDDAERGNTRRLCRATRRGGEMRRGPV
jgi:hypothetical protein